MSWSLHHDTGGVATIVDKITIPLLRLLVDESISPRTKVNTKHVAEFLELNGEWPPVLVRPIVHAHYTHQLIDGFHRVAAAERLDHATISAYSETMDDETALARALRENLHGMPMTPEERKERVVMLRKRGWTQEQIAKESGVTIKQVSNYCGADRVEEELITSGNKSPDLTIAQAAALGKMIPDLGSQQGKRTDIEQPPQLITAPRPIKADTIAEQRKAARSLIPVIAQAAAEHKFEPAIVSALADAALASPEHVPALIEKTITEHLPAATVRHAAKVFADPATSPELAADIVRPESTVRDSRGNMPATEMSRMYARHTQSQPETIAMPFTRYLVDLNAYQQITDTMLGAWIETVDHDGIALGTDIMASVERFFAHVRHQIQISRRSNLHVIATQKGETHETSQRLQP